MKNELAYSEAYSNLQVLVEELEIGEIPLDKLSEKVKIANELILICEKKLRKIETEIRELPGLNKQNKKKSLHAIR